MSSMEIDDTSPEPPSREELVAVWNSTVKALREACDCLATGFLTNMVNALEMFKPLVAELSAAMDLHIQHELSAHPDLAELDVQLQGFYGER